MSNDPTITVSIGTPDSPDAPGYLRDDQWQAFKDDVRDAFRSLSADGTFHYRGEGYGQYRSEDGRIHEELSRLEKCLVLGELGGRGVGGGAKTWVVF